MSEHEVKLTNEERDILLDPCACGHTLNDHGDLGGCWICNDEGDRECWVRCEDMFAERAARIVAARLADAEARTEAAEAKVARVEALAEGWAERVANYGPFDEMDTDNATRALREALSGGMWRPRGHCGAVLSCPNRCACGAEVKAELEAEWALLDATGHDGTGGHSEPESPAEADCGPLRTIYGLVTAMKFRRNQ